MCVCLDFWMRCFTQEHLLHLGELMMFHSRTGVGLMMFHSRTGVLDWIGVGLMMFLNGTGPNRE